MITNNFKKMAACLLQSVGNVTYGMFPITGTNGTTYYCGANSNSGWPATVTTNLSNNYNTAGIVFGTGDTAATANDYRIETPITTGLSGTITYVRSCDNQNGYADIEFTIVLTNTSGEDIVIKEVAYNQTVRIASTSGGGGSTSQVICLDRTVLANPVTVVNGGQATIKYKLRSILSL